MAYHCPKDDNKKMAKYISKTRINLIACILIPSIEIKIKKLIEIFQRNLWLLIGREINEYWLGRKVSPGRAVLGTI
jgi:hypothetical protein